MAFVNDVQKVLNYKDLINSAFLEWHQWSEECWTDEDVSESLKEEDRGKKRARK